jgi:CRISPR/Cas system-associated exonuclease Cas4 (RecB family)
MPKTLRHNHTIITASEVAEFMFCAKAWQLKREGAEPDSPHLAPGTAFHRKHGKQLTFAKKLQRVGWVLVGLALVLVVLWLWSLR